MEVCYKTHTQLAHLGRHKLIEVVTRHFWHPAVDRVAREICASCTHCQLYKIASQQVVPPTIKIQSQYPFDLVALDLLQLQRSAHNNVVVLVAIDHYSKFSIAIPMKDKKSTSVCKALEEQILPHLVRVPSRILTDNGPEFRSEAFSELLKKYNINQTHSTAYKASSNGAVERANRTITEILKGLVGVDVSNWDLYLAKALIIYNSTVHSQLNASPSQFLLRGAHQTEAVLPVDANTVAA